MDSVIDRQALREHLAQAKRRVAEEEAHVLRQRQIVEQLRRNGYDPTRAEALLRTFEEMQAMNVADRDRLLKELGEAL